MSADRPRSPSQLEDEREDLAAHRGVERGDRFVRDQHVRLERERAGDDDALLLSAGQLVWVPGDELLGWTQPGPRQRIVHPGREAGAQPVQSRPLRDRVEDVLPWVQRTGRILQHQLHRAPVLLQCGRGVAQRPVVVTDPPRCRLDQPDHGAGQRRLAAAGLPDEGDDLPRTDVTEIGESGRGQHPVQIIGSGLRGAQQLGRATLQRAREVGGDDVDDRPGRTVQQRRRAAQ
jgi:hypothetical protein